LKRFELLLQERLQGVVFSPDLPPGFADLAGKLGKADIPVRSRSRFGSRKIPKEPPELLDVLGQVSLQIELLFLHPIEHRVNPGCLILGQVQGLGHPDQPEVADIVPHPLAEGNRLILGGKHSNPEQNDCHRRGHLLDVHVISPPLLFPGRFR